MHFLDSIGYFFNGTFGDHFLVVFYFILPNQTGFFVKLYPILVSSVQYPYPSFFIGN